MALFKILKGASGNLPSKITEGYCYVTTDEHKFYVDTETQRFSLNASYADTAGYVAKIQTYKANSVTATYGTDYPAYIQWITGVIAKLKIDNYYTQVDIAERLETSAGSATQPVYFSGGKPVATTYTLEASVPANAKFTDTWRPVENVLTSTSTTNALSANMGRELDKKKVDLSEAGGNALMNALSVGTSTPTDKDYYICQWAGGGNTTTSYHRRSMGAMWNWIKNHADSIYAPKAHTHGASDITSVNASAITGTIAAANLPSYVDDVLEYAKKENFPATGESGKIYVDISTNKTYRWSGTTYVNIGSDLALGETSATAYRGDRGKIAYDHAQAKGKAFTSNLYKITTNDQGHITAAVAASASDIPGLEAKVNRAGDTMTGDLTISEHKIDVVKTTETITETTTISGSKVETGVVSADKVETGVSTTSYFQTQRLRGEGNADSYFHAIDFGYAGHNQVDFHDYGGTFNFYQNIGGTKDAGVLIGAIKPTGWNGPVVGNATSASKWATARTITFTGDITGKVKLDGSSDVNAELTLSGAGTTTTIYGLSDNSNPSEKHALSESGTFIVPVIGIDSKGRVTTDSKTISYTLPANTDTKTTTSSANKTDTTLYLIGATEQKGSGVETYSNKGNFIGTNNYLYTGSNDPANSKKVLAWGDDHSDQNGQHGKGTTGSFGHVKLNDSYVNWTNGNNGIAASPYAVADGVNYAKNRTNATDTSATLYLIGAPTQTSGVYTYSNSNVYINSNNVCAQKFVSNTSAGSWISSRDVAALKTVNSPGDNYLPAFSQKTNNGNWAQGVQNDNIIFAYTTDTDYTAGTNTANIKVKITNEGKLYGAVWNDYAEYRNQDEEIKPGYCVASSDGGKVYKTTEKFQACDGIVSDTYGFAIGENDTCKTPLAVAGRVLAYCTGNRHDYHAGDTVCAGPEGKVVKMTREEIREWPDRIIGIVSEIPEYDTWGQANIPIDGRIWIKVK